MFSLRNSEIRTAWIVSGAIHLAVLVVALFVLFGHAPVNTVSQIVFLVNEGKGNNAAKSLPMKADQAISRAENLPVMQPAAQVPATAAVKPIAAQSAVQGTPSLKKEPARASAYSGQGTIEAKFGDASGLNFRHYEEPVYPQAARRMNKEGRVRLRLTIDENGRLANLDVMESAGFGFTEATIEAVKKWTFIPARVGGVPVKAKVLRTVSFKLTD